MNYGNPHTDLLSAGNSLAVGFFGHL